MNMKSFEAVGYSKQKAIESINLDVNLEKFVNATSKWKNAGSPLNTKDLNNFMTSYLKGTKAMGGYIVVDAAVDDTRQRPYSVINEVTDGKRKTKTFYQIKEAEFTTKYKKENKVVLDEEGNEVTKEVEIPVVKLTAVGAIVDKADKKDAANRLMKELITENKRQYVIEIAKEVVEGKKYASYGDYTPSSAAKQGKFIFFINN